MTDDAQRIADLVELHALCAGTWRTRASSSQDRWLDVFTPDVEYNAFGTPYTLERFPALLEAAPRGQFIGNMPVVELDGDTRHRHAALRVHRPADARDAARLVPRRVRAHRRRVAHPPPLHHVHAQARRLRLRASARSARRRRTEGRTDDRAPEDHQRRRPRRRAARTSGRTGCPARMREHGPARRAGAVGRLLARRRRVVQAGDDRRRPVGRLLALRGPADLRAQAARRDPARRDARRRRQPLRSLEDVHRGDDLRRDAARVATSRRRASTTSRSPASTARSRSRRSRASAARRSWRAATSSSGWSASARTTTG